MEEPSTTLVALEVSIGRLTAIQLPVFSQYVVFTVPVVNIGIYGLTHLRSGEAELIFATALNSS